MSEPCVFCGGDSPTHSETCPKYTPPAVYDLAEFERQLEAQMNTYSAATRPIEAVLMALKASKREAK